MWRKQHTLSIKSYNQCCISFVERVAELHNLDLSESGEREYAYTLAERAQKRSIEYLLQETLDAPKIKAVVNQYYQESTSQVLAIKAQNIRALGNSTRGSAQASNLEAKVDTLANQMQALLSHIASNNSIGHNE